MSSTAADSRGHVRGDSIAQKRVPASQRAQQSPRKGAAFGDAAAPKAPGGAAGPAIPPRLAVRLIAGALALFVLLHFGPSLFSSSSSSASIAAQSKHRKAQLHGAGESWILPRKWRDVQAGTGEVTLNGETLPVCKRVMLFRLSNTHGFSSELLHYARALVIANKLGYTLLADDAEWNYGALSDYFLPRLVYCRPPEDWFSTAVATRVGTRRWQGQDRVWLSRETEAQVDEWIRDEMLDPAAVDELRTRRFGDILPEGETLPAAFEEVFADFASAIKEVWRPNNELATLIRKQRMELGLGGGGLRHRKHSPTWGGNRRLGASPSDASAADEDKDREEWEYGVAERSDRGPVVGVHLGGVQPRIDLSLFGLSPSQKTGNLTALILGAQDAVRRLTHASIASPSYSRVRPTLFPPSAVPTLVALTANSTAFSALAALPSAAGLNVLRTSAPPHDALLRWNDVLRLELTGALAPPSGDAHRLLREWDQKVWNRDVPRALRVLLTRYFVRDLTTLSLYTDAFVVSAASPTGRLALLLSGEDGAVGPRDFHGGSFGGRVRSVDAWWSPTGRAAAVLGA
ncbi:hypothetical protein JCM10450v2_004133 [Rhodotorula kratochvilovae]